MADNAPLPEDKDLLPCPFCGGEARFERKGSARHSTIVGYANCGARLETGEVWNRGNAWNTRVTLTISEAAEPK